MQDGAESGKHANETYALMLSTSKSRRGNRESPNPKPVRLLAITDIDGDL